jgi:hypothetical protein
MRLSAGPSNWNSDLKQDWTNLNIIWNNKGSQDLLKFSLPDNTQKLNDLANIINNYKWENEINIWEKTFSLNDEWVQKIKILLS